MVIPLSNRNLIRFRLRTLLTLTAFTAVMFAVHAHQMRKAQRQMQLVSSLAESGGFQMMHEWNYGENWESGEDQPYPDWLVKWLGPHYFYDVSTFFLESHSSPGDVIESATALRHLRMVRLPGCAISNDSLRPLQTLDRLEWLGLLATPTDDDCMRTIANIKSLRILDLRNTKVTDNCIDSLCTLPSLSRLYVGGTAMTPAGIERLRKSLPNCLVEDGIAISAWPTLRCNEMKANNYAVNPSGGSGEF